MMSAINVLKACTNCYASCNSAHRCPKFCSKTSQNGGHCNSFDDSAIKCYYKHVSTHYLMETEYYSSYQSEYWLMLYRSNEFRGSTLQEKGLYMLVDKFPKYYGASATANPPKNWCKGKKHSCVLSHCLMIYCSTGKVWYFHQWKNRSH